MDARGVAVRAEWECCGYQPSLGCTYYYITDEHCVLPCVYSGSTLDLMRTSAGNCFKESWMATHSMSRQLAFFK